MKIKQYRELLQTAFYRRRHRWFYPRIYFSSLLVACIWRLHSPITTRFRTRSFHFRQNPLPSFILCFRLTLQELAECERKRRWVELTFTMDVILAASDRHIWFHDLLLRHIWNQICRIKLWDYNRLPLTVIIWIGAFCSMSYMRSPLHQLIQQLRSVVIIIRLFHR